MTKEEVTQALYDANTEDTLLKANYNWTAFYQTASQEDKKYLGNEMRKYGQWVLAKCEQSHEEFKEVMAEVEAMKLETNQH
jgi:hypothetical protein